MSGAARELSFDGVAVALGENEVLREVSFELRPGQAVTFDDGFETVYRHAWPVLQELRIPATVFLNTAYLDSPEPFPFDT